jgi:hypothetical protein
LQATAPAYTPGPGGPPNPAQAAISEHAQNCHDALEQLRATTSCSTDESGAAAGSGLEWPNPRPTKITINRRNRFKRELLEWFQLFADPRVMESSKKRREAMEAMDELYWCLEWIVAKKFRNELALYMREYQDLHRQYVLREKANQRHPLYEETPLDMFRWQCYECAKLFELHLNACPHCHPEKIPHPHDVCKPPYDARTDPTVWAQLVKDPMDKIMVIEPVFDIISPQRRAQWLREREEQQRAQGGAAAEALPEDPIDADMKMLMKGYDLELMYTYGSLAPDEVKLLPPDVRARAREARRMMRRWKKEFGSKKP